VSDSADETPYHSFIIFLYIIEPRSSFCQPMPNKSIEEDVLSLLCNQPMTTNEISRRLKSKGLGCPDDLTRLLRKMQTKGLLKGRLSPTDGCWLWWR
jgi:hypothetical protein